MKTATENLENDHVQILRLIEVMEQITGSTDPNTEHMETIVKVIRGFADGLHHAKEEKFLFPLMVQKGFSNESGPVAVMLHDHMQGRNFVKGMADHIALFKQGDSGALNAIISNMLGYTELLRNHIAKENTVLFRLADKVFSPADQELLLLEFNKIELDHSNGLVANDFLTLIDELEDSYNK